ncbi:MAG: ABC transporter permease [Alphaproteobacteria bacterium]|nr:ABC transporter permease [Alphaproteobacteria bacterium]
MALPAYATPLERKWHVAFRVLCVLVFIFLVIPVLIVIPLSFNSEAFFTFPMPGVSLRWYDEFFGSERWMDAIKNSATIAISVTFLATSLGTLAALGLSRAGFPGRAAVMSILIAPIIVPVVISALGMYFFYNTLGLISTVPGIILAHTALATPFVVITVTATLTGFDHSLTRAASGLGARPLTVFFRVILPLILPGVISGALFAFITSWDELIVVLFIASPETRTLPRQMFSGIRDQISPTITAAATILILLSIMLLTTVELLRRRSEKLRGIRP